MAIKKYKKIDFFDIQQRQYEALEKYMFELQQRIDKSIEYIKEKTRNNCWIGQYDACDLIKILKGDDKNG